MAPDGAMKPARSGLSLYANLLDPPHKDSAPGIISGAPVVYKQPQANDNQPEASAAEQKQISAASLRFQPTKRPQISSQKIRSKAANQRPSTASPIAAASEASSDPIGAVNRAPAKITLADWTADSDDKDVNGLYAGEKRQRGGRKKRKKNKEETHVFQNWEDVYDPSRPNTYEDYKNSDEKVLEIREWKDRLYAHRLVRGKSDYSSSDDDDHSRPIVNRQFAPASNLSFAPPASFVESPQPPPPGAPPPEPPNVPDNPTGEAAYARRMRLSQLAYPIRHDNQSTSPSDGHGSLVPPPPPLNDADLNVPSQLRPPASSLSAAPNISRAPVRYNLPAAPSEIPASEAELERALENENQASEPSVQEVDSPRSLRPGQKGFAERLMSKYGWNKGSGLGASSSGITAPLRVQLEKQRRRPDADGGGFIGPGGKGKIIGGKRKDGTGGAELGKFGAMSEVVILSGMVDGMDLDAEIGAGDGGLMQEIGEECGEKYGRVERVFIDRSSSAEAPVFVKFTSQLSALRAVNALEGRIFNGNTITAKFFDAEKFESGVYDR